MATSLRPRRFPSHAIPATPDAYLHREEIPRVADGPPVMAGTGQRGIDLNSATVDEIAAIPGVHLNAARAIVERRDRSGPFRLMAHVGMVSGVGPKTWEALEGAAFVGPVRFPLDINSVLPSWLALARGLSKQVAERIAAVRPISSMDDLIEVAGVGPTVLAALKEVAAVLSGGESSSEEQAGPDEA